MDGWIDFFGVVTRSPTTTSVFYALSLSLCGERKAGKRESGPNSCDVFYFSFLDLFISSCCTFFFFFKQ